MVNMGLQRSTAASSPPAMTRSWPRAAAGPTAHRCVDEVHSGTGDPVRQILHVRRTHRAVDRQHRVGPHSGHEPRRAEEHAVRGTTVIEAQPDDVALRAHFPGSWRHGSDEA